MTHWEDVAIVVPTVASRAALLADLVRQVREECSGARVVIHTHVEGTPARVDFPIAIASALLTVRQWILQLDDDVWLAPGFGRAALAAIEHAEAENVGAVSLFSRSARDLEMLSKAERWRSQPPKSFYMNQAVLLRARALDGFAAWAPSWYEEHPEHQRAADLLLGAWLSMNRQRMLVHVPSLVQHRAVPSTLQNHRGKRQSESYRRAFGEVP